MEEYFLLGEKHESWWGLFVETRTKLNNLHHAPQNNVHYDENITYGLDHHSLSTKFQYLVTTHWMFLVPPKTQSRDCAQHNVNEKVVFTRTNWENSWHSKIEYSTVP